MRIDRIASSQYAAMPVFPGRIFSGRSITALLVTTPLLPAPTQQECHDRGR